MKDIGYKIDPNSFVNANNTVWFTHEPKTPTVSVNVNIEKYENPIAEINSDNEIIVKLGKIKIDGGTK